MLPRSIAIITSSVIKNTPTIKMDSIAIHKPIQKASKNTKPVTKPNNSAVVLAS